MRLRPLFLLSCLLLFTSTVFGQANGKLQIHFIDVGQGDGALLISPLGETVLFDNGKRNNCDLPVSYLQQLGTSKIDYMIASHYHDDHIGCTTEVLTEFPLQKKAYDRGGTYNSSTFQKYVLKLGAKRTAATAGTTIILDAGTGHPVKIEIVALNGNGTPTTNENDLSLVATIRFGNFDAVIAGDLSGFKTGSYEDIETSVSSKVGQVEVYKVNHHGSSYSSNNVWLGTLKPKIGIISAGVGNTYGHPTQECLDRLHAAGVKTYWTEIGHGVEPDPSVDTIGKNILVEATPASWTFTVTYGNNQMDTYPDWGAPPDAETEATYAWSKKSTVYHFAHCKYVQNISAANLEKGNTPPAGKTLHVGCPK
jgi:beta-lactamase superfamily II metal-dependent hydrolase